jgi:hypothetical protein
MTFEELRSVSNAQPFRPFVLHLTDGQEVPVLHPEIVMAVPSGQTILVHQADDTIDVIDLPQVTRLELRPAAGGPGGRPEG